MFMNNIAKESALKQVVKASAWPWRLFEREQVRKERLRLIRNGIITPAGRYRPTIMKKNDEGVWTL